MGFQGFLLGRLFILLLFCVCLQLQLQLTGKEGLIRINQKYHPLDMSLQPNLFRKQLSMRAPHPSPPLTPHAKGVRAACTLPPGPQQLTTLNQGNDKRTAVGLLTLPTAKACVGAQKHLRKPPRPSLHKEGFPHFVLNRRAPASCPAHKMALTERRRSLVLPSPTVGCTTGSAAIQRRLPPTETSPPLPTSLTLSGPATRTVRLEERGHG